MTNLKKLYNKNINIMQYLRDKNNTAENDSESILKSYDLQAGSYVSAIESDEIDTNCYINNLKAGATLKELNQICAKELIKEINKLNPVSTILEAGFGEGTFLKEVKNNINKNTTFIGFDISPSRVSVANSYMKKFNLSVNTFVGDMNSIPINDNAIDIVYTSHAIEPNTNNELQILKELFRITKQYLICIEPSYNLGNEETKKNIDKHHYIKHLKTEAEKLDCKIIKYELFPHGTYTNQSEILILKKNNSKSNNKIDYICPACKNKLIEHKGNYYCDDCLCIYPIVNEIPILLPQNKIIYSKYIEE